MPQVVLSPKPTTWVFAIQGRRPYPRQVEALASPRSHEGAVVGSRVKNGKRSETDVSGASGQTGDRFVGRDDLCKLIPQARERSPVDQIGREDLAVWTLAVVGTGRITHEPCLEA